MVTLTELLDAGRRQRQVLQEAAETARTAREALIAQRQADVRAQIVATVRAALPEALQPYVDYTNEIRMWDDKIDQETFEARLTVPGCAPIHIPVRVPPGEIVGAKPLCVPNLQSSWNDIGISWPSYSYARNDAQFAVLEQLPLMLAVAEDLQRCYDVQLALAQQQETERAAQVAQRKQCQADEAARIQAEVAAIAADPVLLAVLRLVKAISEEQESYREAVDSADATAEQAWARAEQRVREANETRRQADDAERQRRDAKYQAKDAEQALARARR